MLLKGPEKTVQKVKLSYRDVDFKDSGYLKPFYKIEFWSYKIFMPIFEEISGFQILHNAEKKSAAF